MMKIEKPEIDEENTIVYVCGDDKKQYISITLEKLIVLMKKVKKIYIYEYYDGLHVGVKHGFYNYLLKDNSNGEKLIEWQNEIFTTLPNTKLEEFGFETRFPNEMKYSNFTKIPCTLKTIILSESENSRALNNTILKNINVL